MTYELAKELKEAGFPQDVDGVGYWYTPTSIVKVLGETIDIPDKVYNPTLEELIEAVGKYLLLEQEKDGWRAYWKETEFEAPVGLVAIDTFMEKTETGATCTEAVANLWLALNEKR